MKKSFAILTAVLVTLCASSTVLAETPAPTPVDMPQIKAASVPTPYYVVARAANEAPWFTLPFPTRIEVFEGTNVLLQVHFTGDQWIEVFFFREGQLIKATDWCILSHGLYSASIWIQNIYVEDSGVYSIQIVNNHGMASTYVTLDVKERK